MNNRKPALTLLVASTCSAGAALAAPTFHAVSASGTTSVLHGGDRELTKMSFVGSSDVWNGSHFLRWAGGSLTNNIGTYGWTSPIPRDVNANNNVSGNPDRADSATLFVGEAGKTGTLREVFGPFGSGGYKNMSYLIDGEDTAAWTLDLYFPTGTLLNSDANANTVELALLERGGNSDLRITGIRADGSLTSSIMMLRGNTGQAGWTLDSLEISGAQQVHGLGISLDSNWMGLKGFRFEATNGMDGPDLIAVGTTARTLVPAPGALALVGLAGTLASRRRR